MSETQAQPVISSRETSPSHEPLTDEQFGNRLAAVGNHEAKALAYLIMEEGHEYGRPEITRRLKQVSVPTSRPRNEISKDIYSYFGWSLEPIGLLVKHVAEDGKLKFIKEHTDPYATAIAGVSLTCFDNHTSIGLNGLLSETQSNSPDKEKGLRAPLRRLKVMEYIANKEGEMSLRDLSKVIGGDPTDILQNHLEGLTALGIITYKGYHPAEVPMLITRIDSLDAPSPPRYATMTALVAKVLEDLGQGGLADGLTRDELINRIQQTFRLNISRHHLVTSVSQALQNYANYGNIELSNGGIKEVFSVEPDKRDVLKQLVDDLRAIQAGDTGTIAKGIALAQEIASDSIRVGALFEKAYELSPRTYPVGKRRMGEMVLRIVAEHPGITTEGVQNVVNDGLPKKVGRQIVYAALNSLRKEEQLTANSTKTGKRIWSPKK